jgi:hypothetical protein
MARYIIVDIINKDYMKDSNGEYIIYNSEEEARLNCGMYEFENVWVCKLVFNHAEYYGKVKKQ